MHREAKSAVGSSGRNDLSTASRSNGISLSPDSLPHLSASLAKQWKRYRRELRDCQKHFSPEAVHRSRVATRRLLSTAELLAPFLRPAHLKKVRRALKFHLDIFDDLRDTQVQLTTVRKLDRRFPARAFRAYLRAREQRFTRKTRKAIKRLETKRLSSLVGACQDEVAARLRKRPEPSTAALLLRSVSHAFARTVKLRVRVAAAEPSTIHSTRAAFKKFRYMVEALASDLVGFDLRLLEAMRSYQRLMGEIQDNVVLVQVFDKFTGRSQLPAPKIRRLRRELLDYRQKLTHRYLEAADQLHRFWSNPRVRRRQEPRANWSKLS